MFAFYKAARSFARAVGPGKLQRPATGSAGLRVKC